jgi:hypothetical protein
LEVREMTQDTPAVVAADDEIADLRRRMEEFEQSRASILQGFHVGDMAPREWAVLPEALRWYLGKAETSVLAGKTWLALLDEMLERRAARFRLGKWGAVLLTLGTTVLSVVLTVALTALLSRYLPASSPKVK